MDDGLIALKASKNQPCRVANNLGTQISFLDGVAGGSRTIEVSFAAQQSDTFSDSVTVSGFDGDLFVMQLNYDASLVGFNQEFPFLGKYVDGEFINAVNDNTGVGSSVITGYLGGYDVFRNDNTGPLGDYLGSYGVDIVAGTVWAILDNNSQFSVMPEPRIYAALFGVVVLLWAMIRRRRHQA